MSSQRPPSIDTQAAARWQGLPLATSPWLHEEVGRRMAERLGWIKRQPQTWVDWMPIKGGLEAHALVRKRYAASTCHVIELSPNVQEVAREKLAKSWWQPSRWQGGSTHFSPPELGTTEMVWSNMGLHMAADPQDWLGRWQALLAVDGFLMFSCLGPDTLRELRSLYARLGWSAPSHAFTDMHDWGDMLVQAGFAEPVMDMERITLTYATPERLLADLRTLGRNLHVGRFPGLRTPAWRERWLDAVKTGLCSEDGSGQLALTFEVTYGHAFKPVPRQRVAEQTSFSVQDMRAMLKAGSGR